VADASTSMQGCRNPSYYLTLILLYNNRIVNLQARGVTYVGGQTGEGQAQTAGADGRQAQTGCAQWGRGRGWRRSSQNRDVTPGAWLTGADGRAGGQSYAAAELVLYDY